MTFAHAECFPLQWAAEWGVPVTLLALAAIAHLLWRGRRRAEGWTAFLATGALVLLAQNLADVAFEVPAVCIALIVTGSTLERVVR